MKVSILAKLSAVLVALCIPIVILLVLYVQETNVNIDFGQKEVYGNEYLKPLYKGLDSLTQHSLISTRSKKYGINSGSLASLEEKMESAIKEYNSVDKKYGKIFSSTAKKMSAFEDKWKSLKEQSAKMDAKSSLEAHNSLIVQLRDLIVYIGNDSNLILDPDLDTYYLMDATLLKHPSITDYLYQLQILAERIANAQKITNDERTDVVVLSGLIASDIGNLRIDHDTAYENTKDANLKGAVDSNVIVQQNAVKNVMKFIDANFVKSEGISVSINQVASAMTPAIKTGFEMMEKSIGYETKLINDRIGRFNATKEKRLLLSIVVTIIILILGAYQILSVVRAIRKLEDGAKKVSSGEMGVSVELNTKDELQNLAESFNKMVGNISKAIGTIEQNSMNLEALVKETTTSVSQIKQTSDIVSDNARIVADAASVSVTVSEDGQKAVTDSIEGVKRIKEQIESIAEKIVELNSKTQVINKIISAVDDLTKQSKILAFNASIEASKAGEAGKGFAVVANEIKNLSEESRESTRKISEIINEIQELTNTVVMMTEQGTKLADQGFQLANSAGETIEKLAFSIQNASEAAFQISSSAIEQKSGMDQLEETMRNAVLAGV